MQNRHRRNLQSAAELLDKAASGLFSWLATDHSGIGRMFKHLLNIGFIDRLLDILVCFLTIGFGVIYDIFTARKVLMY
ncbi:MAG: hypothetical protein ABTQ25_14140 [Nitrosomonas ureae]